LQNKSFAPNFSSLLHLPSCTLPLAKRNTTTFQSFIADYSNFLVKHSCHHQELMMTGKERNVQAKEGKRTSNATASERKPLSSPLWK
jgi:hypothetical protein